MSNKELRETLDKIAAKIEDEIVVNDIISPLLDLVEQLDEEQNNAKTISVIMNFLRRVYVFNILAEVDSEGLAKICEVINQISQKEDAIREKFLHKSYITIQNCKLREKIGEENLNLPAIKKMFLAFKRAETLDPKSLNELLVFIIYSKELKLELEKIKKEFPRNLLTGLCEICVKVSTPVTLSPLLHPTLWHHRDLPKVD